MIRLGFFLGFLIGAAAGAVLAREPASDGAPRSGASETSGAFKGLRDRGLAAIHEAREAARIESKAKEEELRREFESGIKHPDGGEPSSAN